MRTYIQKIFTVVKTASRKWFEKDPFRESVVIAYYAIFALPGLLVIIMTLCGYFFGREAVNNQVAAKFSSTIGSETAKQIQDIIIQASRLQNFILASIIGIITILIGKTPI
jgi:membrane protein